MGHVKTRGDQRGAAILLALLIMTLVATLAAGMVWLQWRGIEVEAAERARTQGTWLLNASLDWGNLILKSSIRTGDKEDDLGQPWATPLAETKLSSFLSADGNHQDDSGPEAYLSGQITDATSKYNLYNLVVESTGKSSTGGNGVGRSSEIVRLQNLLSAIGVSPDVANTLGAQMRASWSAQQQLSTNSGQADTTNSVLMPVQMSDLAWFGIDAKTIKMMEPFVDIIPLTDPTKLMTVNANTAPAEVLMAGCPMLTRANAEQIILQRRQKPFEDPNKVMADLGGSLAQGCNPTDPNAPGPILAVTSQYFEIYGQLRYEQHVIRELSVVYRKDQFTPVQVLRRERLPPDVNVAAAATGA